MLSRRWPSTSGSASTIRPSATTKYVQREKSGWELGPPPTHLAALKHSQEVTEDEMEAYRLAKVHKEDPMANFTS